MPEVREFISLEVREFIQDTQPITFFSARSIVVGVMSGSVVDRSTAKVALRLLERGMSPATAIVIAWFLENPATFGQHFPEIRWDSARSQGTVLLSQCRVVVIPDMVGLTQNKIWVSLTSSRRPHTSSTRTRRDQKSQRKRSPSTAARSRAQAASGCRRARSTAVHGGAEPAVAALVGASGVKMMRWSAMLNGGVASP